MYKEGKESMFLPQVLMTFLYFPEDKSQYIPALIKLLIMVFLAVLVMRAVVIWSKREEKKAEDLEKNLKANANKKDS